MPPTAPVTASLHRRAGPSAGAEVGPSAPQPSGAAAAWSAAAVTVPHAVGLGLLAFAPLAGEHSLAALALWSAALPGLLLTLATPRAGVVYAPTTVVALLFAAVLATAHGAAPSLGLSARQVLAVSGATVALAFVFQWLLGVLRLASVARFLPISVTHGFAAGVGLSMVVGQVRNGFGAGGDALWDARTGWHLLAALAVVGLAWGLRRRWPRMPGLLSAVALVALAVALAGVWGVGLGSVFVPAVPPSVFAWPMLPDWTGIPWMALARQQGSALVVLAVLMALVNSLEILVFNQELELDHGLRGNANLALRRESLLGALCGLVGMIPASTSASRSRIVLAQAGASRDAPRWHAAIMLGVAVTGAWWLHWVPMACLAGGLVLAGLMQVPGLMWSLGYARRSRVTWAQSWLVALVFAVMGGVGALVAGLVVATFVLLHDSAATVLRHVRLDGELRSRRLRRAGSDSWLTPRMNQVAVFELQGVMSFGVAAHLAEQVRMLLLPRHRWVILDAGRVPAWDSTAMAQLRALVRDLDQQGIAAAVAALDPMAAEHAGEHVRAFADLDRALEWAEVGILSQRPIEQRPAHPERDMLGEVGEGVPKAAAEALQALLVSQAVPPHGVVFHAGDTDHDLLVVKSGHITLVTQWPPDKGLRLATVGPGMAFGEMAFLNGAARSACAGAERGPAHLVRLSRAHFDAWARQYPEAALTVMNNLAQIGARRLAVTTRQLRAVLE
ncbi:MULTISPECIES: cyclic nucleotide-binding domain-containing protein [unclassified Acidovorax]|uniref:cyclic nucleotide-binding domain-containing protein n=1 Tax=unclassified Acidovorax TaxID=2684926 RepID=UPI000C19178E|nr:MULTISPECIES: cyclic nucleotide-binding domain-containing protein [unclassified Acidovorax]PIF16717.1 SulP family sulfate permease [Acidovorax sp. 59]PKW04259.1 SulP family sulfate permease [Acidovorax sp. 30]